jgi:hypothetical protein
MGPVSRFIITIAILGLLSLGLYLLGKDAHTSPEAPAPSVTVHAR